MNAMHIGKKIVSILFVVLIFSVFLSVFCHKIIQKLHSVSEDTIRVAQTVFAESKTDLYGNALSVYNSDSDGSVDRDEPNRVYNHVRLLHFVKDYFSWFTELVEHKYTDDYFGRTLFVLSKRQFDKTMGMNLTTSVCGTENDTRLWTDVILENESHDIFYFLDNADISDFIEQVTAFGRKIQSHDMNFLFFIAPEKPERPAKQYKGVFQSCVMEKTRELEQALAANGLPYISYDAYLAGTNVDADSLFFHTDHHWLPQTALDADRLISEKLNDLFGYSIDPAVFDLSNYNIEYMDKPYLGQQGERVTTVYIEAERFPILSPHYPSDVEVYISEMGKARGRIEDVLMDRSALDFPMESLYRAIPFNYYGYGNQALIQIHNNQIHDGKKILMIKTSFACPMYPFLSSVVEQLDVIDSRIFSGSIEKYIGTTQPDTVIIVCGISMFNHHDNAERSFFDFH